jgi:S-adenosylmethionine:tRNA ribosyltransferase-isomerase
VNIEEFDFEYPPELIASEPLIDRDQSKLLVVGESFQHKKVYDLPDFLEPGDVLVLNNTKVIPARLNAKRKTGGKVELLVIPSIAHGDAHGLWLGHDGRVTTSEEPNVIPNEERKNDIPSERRKNVIPSEEPNVIPSEEPNVIPSERSDRGDLPANICDALINESKTLKVGEKIIAPDDIEITIEELSHPVKISFPKELDVFSFLQKYGMPPLPPYIKRETRERDKLQYQTIYAEIPGAVAAPTAGLHFTPRLLEKIDRKEIQIEYISRHVGLGTFQPVRVENINEHKMHEERYEISEYSWDVIMNAERVVAVGTTTTRALESASLNNKLSGKTDLFITPGFDFKIVDKLMTNFHQPRSTLLMMVSAFAGIEKIKAAYSESIENRYRLFSYGDAMLLPSK